MLSNDEAKATGIAERLGKRGEEGVYYRRLEGGVRTVLVPRRGDLLKAAECLTLSTYYYLYVGEIDAEAAELALLAKASGLGGRAATDDEAAFRGYFGELGLELGELEDVDRRPDEPWSPWRARWDSRGHPPSNPRRPPASPPTG